MALDVDGLLARHFRRDPDPGNRSARLRTFQQERGLPETGRPDGETRAALGRLAEAEAYRSRWVTGDDTPPSAPDARSTGAATSQPPVARLESKLRTALEKTADASAPDSIARAVDAARSRLGIPGVGESHPRRDGWRVQSQGHVRYIGMLRWFDAGRGIQENARVVIERLQNPRTLEHVRDSLSAVEGVLGRRLDRSLVLAVATRESGRALNRRAQRMDTYGQGGLDNAWGLRDTLPVPDGVRRRMRPAEVDEDGVELPQYNEQGAAIHPASVPESDLMSLTAARVALAEARLESGIRTVFGENVDAAAMVSDLGDDARRALTQVAFGGGFGADYAGEGMRYGGSFGLRTVLGRLRDQGGDLERVLDDSWLGQFDRVRRAKITAAESSVFAETVALR